MNKKLQKIIEPGTRLFVLIMAGFAVATFFFGPKALAFMELALIALLIVYYLLVTHKRRKQLMEYIENVTYNAESAKNNTLMNFPLPIVVFNLADNHVVWGNQVFFDLLGDRQPSFEAVLTDLVPGFSSKWLLEGKRQYPGLIQVGERKYQLHGNIIREKSEDGRHAENFMGITYWVDVTDFDNIKTEYERSRPVTMLFVVDNYDELMKNVPDRMKVELRGRMEDHISHWVDGKHGLMRRYDRDRYMFIFERRYLTGITEKKFDVLDSIHEIVSPTGVHATLSIGVGMDGDGFEENFAFANLASEMALSRGGDQAVIKNRFSFEFFGGKNMEVETRSKVKSRVTANALAELMRASGQIFVMGHKFSDLDSIGAAAGVACIARKLGKAAKIVVDPEQSASRLLIESLRNTPEYREVFLQPNEAIVKADSRTLLVVVDTNRPEQVESRSLLEACTRVAVLDHHRRSASYIQNAALTFQEPYASSVCELVSEMLQELVEPNDITPMEARAVLSGMVLDTKYFSIRTGERTFDAAAFLRRMGADTAEVKKYMQSDIVHAMEKFNILQNVQLYRDSIAIAVKESSTDRVVAAQAADELLNIAGIRASFVAYPTDAGGVVFCARSIGEVNVQIILEKLGGGGNMSAAGAQLADIDLQDAVSKLCASIDEFLDT